MIGKNKLKDLLPAIIPQPLFITPQEPEVTLYEKKVKLLLARYFFLCQKHKNEKNVMDKVLRILENEFFISSKRIADIIVDNTEVLAKIRSEAPPKLWYQRLASHIIW